MLENFCANYRPYVLRNACSANNFGVRNVKFPEFSLSFVRIKYTSNMAACYNNDADDVTAPHASCIFATSIGIVRP